MENKKSELKNKKKIKKINKLQCYIDVFLYIFNTIYKKVSTWYFDKKIKKKKKKKKIIFYKNKKGVKN